MLGLEKLLKINIRKLYLNLALIATIIIKMVNRILRIFLVNVGIMESHLEIFKSIMEFIE